MVKKATKAKEQPPRKPAAKVSAQAAAARSRIMESKWTHEDGGEIVVNMHVAVEQEALFRENSRLDAEVKRLRTELDELSQRHSFLLRDSATQGRILATYREMAAAEVEKRGAKGTLALAT